MNNFNKFNFSEGLKESLKEAIKHEKKELNLRTFIRANIPELTSFDGNEIKEIRKSIECTQAMFAEIFGVTKTTIEYWESGKNKPNGSAQRLLALIKKKRNKFIEEDLEYIGVSLKI